MFNFDTDVLVGDWVMYSSHPGAGVSYPALVVAKGGDSVEVVVYAWNGAQASASHKSGVRHQDNPVFQDPVILANILADGDSGCFVLHPNKVLVNLLCERIAELEEKVLKGKGKGKPIAVAVDSRPDPKPDLSFRMDDGPELTEEQKEAKRLALEAAR